MRISITHIRASLLIYVVGMATGLLVAPISPGLALMAADIAPGARGAFLSQMVLTSPTLAMVFTAPFVGLIAEHIGYKRTLLGGLAAYIFFGCAGLVLSNVWIMIPFRFLFGIAAAAVITPGCVLISRYFDSRMRDRLFGFMTTSAAAFAVTGSAVSGVIVHDFGWHATFALYALAVPPLLVMPFILPAQDVVAAVSRAADGSAQVSAPDKFPLLAVIGIMMIVAWLILLSFNPSVQLPFVLSERDIHDPRWMSLVFVGMCLAQMTGSLFYGWLSGWLNTRYLVTVMLAAFGLGHLMIGFSAAFVATFIGGVLIGFGAALIKPTAASYMFTIAPVSTHGRISGLLISSISMGGFLNPIVMSPIAAVTGLTGAFCLLGVVNIVGALIAAVPMPRLHRALQR